jgi:hypothetical protein
MVAVRDTFVISSVNLVSDRWTSRCGIDDRTTDGWRDEPHKQTLTSKVLGQIVQDDGEPIGEANQW